ncbi:hypothetical protein FPV67DRAFT_169641 [Lyophyllum atratum]|nr:hypothetical protein FPV67DRAFT_169641 [Lyophyllum atratum]
MFATVVSRVRRTLRRQKSRHQLQPPDLRRWSDFMNPFPHVSPGGYRLYYETHGMPEPKALPTHDPASVSSPRHPTPRPRRQNASSPSSCPSSSSIVQPAPSGVPVPFPPSLPESSKTPSSRRQDVKNTTRTLSIIPETSTGTPNVRIPALSNTSSLRRRRRRLLRTPSVERDFPSRAPTIASIRTADLDGFSSESVQSHESNSSQSHIYSVDTPPTTVEGLGDEDLSSPVSAKDGAEYDDDDDDRDLYERPDSRSSYCTARSGFSDD